MPFKLTLQFVLFIREFIIKRGEGCKQLCIGKLRKRVRRGSAGLSFVHVGNKLISRRLLKNRLSYFRWQIACGLFHNRRQAGKTLGIGSSNYYVFAAHEIKILQLRMMRVLNPRGKKKKTFVRKALCKSRRPHRNH